jgi:hypothetical protein
MLSSSLHHPNGPFLVPQDPSGVIISSATDPCHFPPFFSPSSTIPLYASRTGMSLGSKTAHTWHHHFLGLHCLGPRGQRLLQSHQRVRGRWCPSAGLDWLVLCSWYRARFSQANLGLPSTSRYLSLLACSFQMLWSFHAI